MSEQKDIPLSVTHCQRCNADIVFVKSQKTGKVSPLNAKKKLFATEEAGQVQALLDRDDEIRRLRARAETAEASVAAMRAVLGDSDLAWADRFERLAKEPT